MYLDFYGFREKPFNLTPDPRFVFLSKNHKEAFAHLLYGIKNQTGFIVLTGEVGTGKTTVLRALLGQLDQDHYRTALIFNPCLSPSELLQNIAREFGIPTNTSNISSLLDALNMFLLKENTEGRTVVLAIDESQNLDMHVLEQIRLISNLETDREKLIQIVLSGQPEFGQILKKKEMRQLSQRITVRYHLESMDFQDTVLYIAHRLEVAGGKSGDIFSMKAMKRIYRYSGGLPRLINAACDRTLLAGYTRDASQLSSRLASAGIRDIKKNRTFYIPKRQLFLIPMFAFLAAVIAAGFYLSRHDFIVRFNTAQNIEAKEGQAKEDSLITGEKLSGAMAAELGKMSESESARMSFNNLAGLWHVPPVPAHGDVATPSRMERAALDRELRLYVFSGNLGALLRFEYPSAVELIMPGIPGKRYISLVGMEEDRLLINPTIGGKVSLSFKELERYWSGRGFLLWKDSHNLFGRIYPGSKGKNVKRLQALLKEAGALSKPLTGIYDGDTMSAVKIFQRSKGIEDDGIAGAQTLMFLYRSIDRFEVPKVAEAGRK